MMAFDRQAYLECLENLYRISPSVQTFGFSGDAYKPGLDGMRALDSALGSPSSRLRCIHVAGTNGKGSVCCMLAASLAASGLRVGLYTSPHLLDFRERIKILPSGSGSFGMIPEEDVFGFLQDRRSLLGGRSFFEVTTAMAFWWFDRQNVDIAVIEVGLGGLLDSTNIINPEISIVTSIDLDHCSLLGDTRAEIAAQKAGIFKAGTPALVWGHDPETDPVFESVAARIHCPLFYAGCAEEGENPNSGTVRTALELLGMEPDEGAIAAFRSVCGLRGRWETLLKSPETICDIGHNPAALKLGFERLRAGGRPLVIVYGVMADKDYRTNVSLIPEGAYCFLASPAIPRALATDALMASFREIRPDLQTKGCESVADAVKSALEYASGIENALVFIGGSTFMVSEAMKYLEKI